MMISHLDTLGGHSQERVPDSLDLGVHGRLAGEHHHHQLQGGEGGLQVAEHRLDLDTNIVEKCKKGMTYFKYT